VRCASPTTGTTAGKVTGKLTGTAIGTAWLALATLVVAGAAGLLGVTRAAPASAAADCVAVIVDARQLGGSLRTGCAQVDPSNGFQALSKAGFGFTPRPRDGLVCQIDGAPACADTTSSTYWSYWYRAPGSRTWVYANEGAGTHNPRPGSTEAWVWQDGGKTAPPDVAASTICPQLKAQPKPKPAPPTASSRPTRTSKPAKSKTAGTAGGAGPSASGAPRSPSATASGPTGSAAATTSSAAATTSSAAAVPTSGPAGSSEPSTAPPTGVSSPVTLDAKPTDGPDGALPGGAGVALGAILVLGIGAAAALRARRNRAS
jgi:hypothetical protein